MKSIFFVKGCDVDDITVIFENRSRTLSSILDEMIDLREFKRSVLDGEEVHHDDYSVLKEQYQNLENVVQQYQKWFKDREHFNSKV